VLSFDTPRGEMIEVIYKEDSIGGSGTVKLPKNVTQVGIGKNDSRTKVYMENDVVAHIQKPCVDGQVKYGVLLGSKEEDEYQYIFVKKYVEVPTKPENIILFNDDVWLKIYDNIKANNIEGEIVGWYASFPQGRLSGNRYYSGDLYSSEAGSGMEERLKKLHLDNFAGINKILFCHEDESEDGVYIYNNGTMEHQSVYYVYWGSGGFSAVNKSQDKAEPNPAAEFREKSKKPVKDEEMKKIPWGSVAVIGVLVGTLAFMGNSGMLKSLTARAKSVIGRIREDGTTIFMENTTPTIVDVAGNVTTTPPEETSSEEDATTTKAESDSTEKDSTEKEDNNDEETTTVNDEDAAGSITGTEYVVQAGETLFDISRKFYNDVTKVAEIVAANEITDPDKIYAGQKLILP